MILDLTPRKGIYPRMSPEELPPGACVVAENCKFSSGDLVPLKATVAANAVIVAACKSLFRHFGDWLSWDYDTDVAKCPIAADAFGRIYFATPLGGSADGRAQMLNYYTDTAGTKNTTFIPEGLAAPAGSYHLGMPAPLAAPVLGSPSGGDASNPEDVVYVYTYGSRFGEESPPSPPATVTRNVGGQLQVSWAQPDTTSADNYLGRAPVEVVNIYRSNKGSSTTEYLFVTQRPVADGSWVDTIANANLTEEILATTFWDPPVKGIMGLINLEASRTVAGFKGNSWYESEVDQPHAWPVQNRIAFAHPIVAHMEIGMSVLVVTTGPAFLIVGNTPGSRTPEKIEASFSCVAKRSMVDLGDAGAYASPVGIIGVTPSGSQIVTKDHLRKEEWEAFLPATMSAWQYANNFVGCFDGGGGNQGALVFSSDGNLTTLDAAHFATAGWYDQADGELYLVIGGSVVQYDVGPSKMTATCRSRVATLPGPTNFGVAKVQADGYPVTFRLYDYTSGVAVLKESRTVANNKPFRLSSGYRYEKVAVEIITSHRVTSVFLAHTVQELGTV